MRELRVEELYSRLASADPTPGGGSASALAGALAAALVAMVARTTIGKKKFADRAAAMEKVRHEAERLGQELLAAAEEDARAFDAVMAAYRLAKGTPEEEARRGVEIQAATKGATEAPLRVSERALRVLELARQVAEQGNPNAASDAGVASLLAEAAVQGALLNVRINLGQLADAAYREATGAVVAELRQRAAILRSEALAAVEKNL